MDYNILKIEPSKKQFCEPDPTVVVCKQLSPAFSYKNEMGIYITCAILFLLAHYMLH